MVPGSLQHTNAHVAHANANAALVAAVQQPLLHPLDEARVTTDRERQIHDLTERIRPIERVETRAGDRGAAFSVAHRDGHQRRRDARRGVAERAMRASQRRALEPLRRTEHDDGDARERRERERERARHSSPRARVRRMRARPRATLAAAPATRARRFERARPDGARARARPARAPRARDSDSMAAPRRPVLLLDVDGVLNRTATAKQIALDEDLIALLRDVTERSACEVVLTTYWRYFEVRRRRERRRRRETFETRRTAVKDDATKTRGLTTTTTTTTRFATQEYLAYAFERHGLPKGAVVGRTAGEPHRSDSVAHDSKVPELRVLEIERYMRETHGEDETAWPPFAVVDDKEVVSAEHRWRGRFVRTKHDVGLTKAQADALIDILSR